MPLIRANSHKVAVVLVEMPGPSLYNWRDFGYVWHSYFSLIQLAQSVQTFAVRQGRSPEGLFLAIQTSDSSWARRYKSVKKFLMIGRG